MATALQLRFPGRRYHATPWGAHVNEGQIEWPPSPWRLLRALLSTGFTKLGWPPDGPPSVARRLIERLAEQAPEVVLPPVSLAHSRHYVDAAGKKPLILDTWANVEQGVVELRFEVELDEDQRALLSELAENLGYLGRAESWVEARLMPPDAPPAPGERCRPSSGGPPGPGWEPVRVRCPVTAAEYDRWRAARVAPVLEALGFTGKRPSAAQQKKLDQALAPFPRDLVAALCAETSTLQRQGWSEPPGCQERVYYRRADALSVSAPVVRGASVVEPVPLALLSITTPSGSHSALPPLHRVFPQGRLLHLALASVVNKAFDGDPSLAEALLGRVGECASDGDHRHAHLLPLDLGGQSRLDHVLVYAPMGLDGRALEALGRVRKTYMKGGAGELRVALAGWGDREVMRAVAEPQGGALRRVLGPRGGATTWISATPYVAPRMLKRRGKDSLEGLIASECARRAMGVITSVERLDVREVDRPDGATAGQGRGMGFRAYPLHDARHAPPYSMTYTLRLTFAEPVEGPICLGYGAHVGLGRFEIDG